MSDTIVICASLLLALGGGMSTLLLFPWDKVKSKPHDDVLRRFSALEFDVKQQLSEARATIDTLRRDMLGHADDARRSVLRVANDLEDKKVFFEMALQRAENERSKTMQDAADMMSRRR